MFFFHLAPFWSVPAAAAGGPIARTGTASQVDASGGDGSTSITVAACNLAIAFWEMWDNDQGSSLSTLTLNGAGFTIAEQRTEASNLNCIGVAYLANPSTSTQTLAWTWSLNQAKAGGGKIVVVYIENGNTADPFRDTAIDANTSGNDVSISLTTVSTDLVLALGTTDGAALTLDGTPFIDDALLNGTTYDVCEVTTGDPTTTVAMVFEQYSSIVGIALKAA